MQNMTQGVIEDVVQSNVNAVAFYHSARQQTKNRRLAALFSSLEKLHKKALLELDQKLNINIQIKDPYASKVVPISLKAFEHISNTDSDVDIVLIEHMKDAKRTCDKSVKRALGEKSIHILTKIFLKNLKFLIEETYRPVMKHSFAGQV